MSGPVSPWHLFAASAEQQSEPSEEGDAAAEQRNVPDAPEKVSAGEKATSRLPKLLEFSRWRKVCKACASHGEAEDHFKFFQTLFLQDCILCEESFCSDHAGPFAFPAGALPEGSRTTVCSTCLPQADAWVKRDDQDGPGRQTREVRASVQRLRARRVGCHDESKPENAKHCIECDAAATGSCEVCGLKLCTSHISLEPPDAPQARRLRVCSSCRGYAAARVAACEAVRKAKAQSFRAAVAGAVPRLVAATLEEAEDCAKCGLVFSKLPGSLRHHCRACGRSLCAVCLCGVANCLVNAARCPHTARLHGPKEERVCAECLPATVARLEARKVLASVAETACKYADHCLRVETFLQDPEQLPLYEANHVDTVQDKLLRAGGFAVEGAKRAAPLLSLPWALGVRAMDVVWNYGQHCRTPSASFRAQWALPDLSCQLQISVGTAGPQQRAPDPSGQRRTSTASSRSQWATPDLNGELPIRVGNAGPQPRGPDQSGIKTLLGLSSTLQDIPPRDLLVGILYLSAEQRKTLRDSPDGFKRLAQDHGKPLPPQLLEALLGMACNVVRVEAWKIKRLVSVFSRSAKRGHYPRESVIRSPALDLPSTEKIFKHDIVYQEGSFECKTCGTVAATSDAITSQPCTRRGVSRGVPGKSSDCVCRLIEFSFDWPTKVQEMIGEQTDETWELQQKNGKTFRITNCNGELYYEGEVPKKTDFPVMIAPVPKEKIIEEAEEELERLKIEEALLSEMLHLAELQSQVNSTVPASSDAAPSSFLDSKADIDNLETLPFSGHMDASAAFAESQD
eukprot:s1087_g5.t1